MSSLPKSQRGGRSPYWGWRFADGQLPRDLQHLRDTVGIILGYRFIPALPPPGRICTLGLFSQSSFPPSCQCCHPHSAGTVTCPSGGPEIPRGKPQLLQEADLPHGSSNNPLTESFFSVLLLLLLPGIFRRGNYFLFMFRVELKIGWMSSGGLYPAHSHCKSMEEFQMQKWT